MGGDGHPNDMSSQQTSSTSLLAQVKGLVLISTGVEDSTLLVKRGPPIFRHVPIWILRCLQPMLTNAFLKMGLSPTTHQLKPELIRAAKEANNQNDMEMVCHYYRAHDWITKDELSRFYFDFIAPNDNQPANQNTQKRKVLVVHGVEDQIVPVEKGQIVANILVPNDENRIVVGEERTNFVTIPDASHSVMQEQPDTLAEQIFQFILMN